MRAYTRDYGGLQEGIDMSDVKDIRNEELDALFDAFLMMESREDCYNLFCDMFTDQEMVSFARRLRVAKLLLNGATYGMIQEQLPVSSATITRINTVLQYGEGGYRHIVERLTQRQKDESES